MRLLTLLLSIALAANHADAARFTFSCDAKSDLFLALQAGGADVARFGTPGEALDHAGENSALMVLADGYPDQTVAVDAKFYERAKQKGVHLYVEYPAMIPDVVVGKGQTTQWERTVVASEMFGESLPKLRILHAHNLRYLPIADEKPLLVIARVAGYDSAIYGIPKSAGPLLVERDEGKTLIATTKLSQFVTGRFEPVADWRKLWVGILGRLDAGAKDVKLDYEPVVGPAMSANEALPADVERRTFDRAAVFYKNSRLLLAPERKALIHGLLTKGVEDVVMPGAGDPVGDGTLGILEGYSSGIAPDGSQLQRAVLRSDCNTESAMVLAMHARTGGDKASENIAKNLLDWVYFNSGICKGVRGDPTHPSFGHIAWGDVSPAWLVGNYGDDDARCILATIAASAAVKDERWNEHVLRSLLANLRTTGKFGFRGDRIDVPALEQYGWKHFQDAATVNYSPHFEAYLWACNLWAYARTKEPAFLEKTKTAIGMTMAAYPDKWRWGDNIERSRMLLPLAWLVRVEDTAEHRQWIQTVAGDLLKNQVECGAIQEHYAHAGGGHFQIPKSNEAYGTGETPLIQANGDPACDQLYTTGFALLALREAVGATGDPKLREAEDKLAEFLCRVQVRSEKLPWLDGTWFRAFDFKKWDYWSSSADAGWGAWSVEAGWAQAWTAATLALRMERTTLWDFTAGSSIVSKVAAVKSDMGKNDGSAPKQ
jgi:hypothetical protein